MRKQRHYRGGYDFTGLLKLGRELRKHEIRVETFLWQLLRDRKLLGFKFRRQHQIGRYIADFYCREAQLVIASVMVLFTIETSSGNMTRHGMPISLNRAFA